MLNYNLIALLYLVSGVLFILSLKGLSSPESSRQGNVFGMIGMAIAIATTFYLLSGYSDGAGIGIGIGTDSKGYTLIIAAILAGGAVGTTMARKVEMTAMPQLVAFMHSLIGLAAVLIAVAALVKTDNHMDGVHRLELFIGAFIGAITFTASVVAFGKLSGRFGNNPVRFAGQHKLNLLLGLAMFAAGSWYFINENHLAFFIMLSIALLLGYLLIIPIGGADMPVIVSMLNSYSGWAAAGIGFTLNNSLLIIAGSLVGSSGAILSYIMCKAMNRSLLNVILGGLGGETFTASGDDTQKNHKSGSPEDAGFLMKNADSVIIVPGYGLAVARAQHALQELAEKLEHEGVKVRYAIHPVAGRMPGHMNVLLAEAEVPYDQVLEMDEINNDFSSTDVVLVIGANDVVNPAAKDDPASTIYGMPILEAYRARTILVVKRSMAAGYAGLDNNLFYMDKTMMVFGDAKKVIEDMVKSI
jgi:NAD(P) transhydrogenase subunit beta